jgi:Tol biopolymer transport system component/DNA-binding SARP family transcriptional activator
VLLALFWPELDTAHARTSLRNALHVLRRTLGDAILRTRGDEEVSIDPALVQSDLADVWAALRDDRAEDAMGHYGGELLVGLFPPDSDGFMRWLETERARLRVALSSAASARVNELERDGNVERALAVARRIVEINRDDETLVRRLMSLHEMSGDRAGALQAFESYRARLASDFDAEPAPETVAIATRLRSIAPVSLVPPLRRANLTPAPAPSAVSVPRAGNRTVLAVSAVAVTALAIGAAILWGALRPVHPASIGTSAPLTAEEGLHVGAAISSNGRLVAYAKGNPRLLRIYVARISGGPPWRLTRDSGATEIVPRWAPDDDRILFLSRNNAYVAPSTGGAPRVVARGMPGDHQVRSASWSPKGDSIAIVRNDSLIAFPLSGSAGRTVGVAKGRQLHSCVWSPANTWIACVAGNFVALRPGPLFGNEAPSAIVLFPSAGGNLVEVTGNESQSKSPAWSPDGKFLWLVSDRDGTAGDVYAVPIGRDGRPSGAFTRAGITGAESIDLSEKRIIYSVVPVRRANVWAVPVPRDTVLSFAAAGMPITSGTDLIELLNVSPDGKWLIYDSNKHGNADIFRRLINGDSVERLTDDPRREYSGVLSPDGRELVWHRYVNGKRRLFSRRLDTDSAHEISFGSGDQGVPHWSPDGRSLVAWSHDTEEGEFFVMHRAARRAWQPPAWRFHGGRLPGWSPDGRAIAFIAPDDGIATIPADSGVVRVVYRPRPDSDDPNADQLIWKDPSTIWFIGSDWRGRSGIWSVPARGGAARLRVDFDDPSGRANGIGFATDGKRFYIALDERFSNVRWAELVR